MTWTWIAPAVTAAFLASLVEDLEARTIVLEKLTAPTVARSKCNPCCTSA